MSKIYYEFANFLISSWRLGQPGRDLPVGHERLDRALEAVESHIPTRFQGVLLFCDSAVGRVCHTLPAILQAAAESHLIQPIPPRYLNDRVVIGASRAMDILENLDIEIEDGKAFGKQLADAVDRPANTQKFNT
ncbi:hypothetical protein [Rhizobium sp. MHM7A]|uniref:hypothetical protein n=1 Tax=Rhizobium sp. MHM7A TaxID=2583233 RepID=UPI00110606DA|nr:hypothetical protein [Rhizobium sp. MHM7A]TLX16914.1 hypothetical protein FFR93_06090 [Rhizobium sp. MHM7A]